MPLALALGQESAQAQHATDRQELIGRIGRRPHGVVAEQPLEARRVTLLGDGLRQFQVGARPGQARLLAQVGLPVGQPAQLGAVGITLRRHRQLLVPHPNHTPNPRDACGAAIIPDPPTWRLCYTGSDLAGRPRSGAGISAGSPDATLIIARLEALASPEDAAGMARFGICGARVLGVSVKTLRAIAREAGRSHPLAEALWASGIHEARILAGFVLMAQVAGKDKCAPAELLHHYLARAEREAHDERNFVSYPPLKLVGFTLARRG